MKRCSWQVTSKDSIDRLSEDGEPRTFLRHFPYEDTRSLLDERLSNAPITVFRKRNLQLDT